MTFQQLANASSINSSLEKDILSEYEKLSSHVYKVNETIAHMNTNDIVVLVDKLRALEKKIGLVYTLFKASVYSMVTAAQENIEHNTNRPSKF